MRTREEIEEAAHCESLQKLILEVSLDIRDILTASDDHNESLPVDWLRRDRKQAETT